MKELIPEPTSTRTPCPVLKGYLHGDPFWDLLNKEAPATESETVQRLARIAEFIGNGHRVDMNCLVELVEWINTRIRKSLLPDINGVYDGISDQTSDVILITKPVFVKPDPVPARGWSKRSKMRNRMNSKKWATNFK